MRLAALLLSCAAAAAFAAPAAAQERPPVPTGPNGAVLGNPDQFAVSGPAHVCFVRSAVRIDAGETAYLDYLGIHDATIRVIGGGPGFRVSEGDGIVPAKQGEAIVTGTGFSVHRIGEGSATQYWLTAPAAASNNGIPPMLRLSGPALSGDDADLEVIARVTPEIDGVACAQRFIYGMNFEEPVEAQ